MSQPHVFSLSRRLTAEALGTALLLAIVVGSGIMAERLCGGNIGLALLANAVATGAGLYAIIMMFAPISGAHFNPVVSLYAALNGQLNGQHTLAYIGAQVAGAGLGVMAAHLMFDLPILSLSEQTRTGAAQWWSEAVATFGLLAVIISTSRHQPQHTPMVVALYITAAYWFTASTSFANPAVTLARSLTNTFAGIALVDVWGFIAAQLIGLGLAIGYFGWLYRQSQGSSHA